MSETYEINNRERRLPVILGRSNPPTFRQEALLATLPFLLISLSGLLTLFQGLGWLKPESLVSKAIATLGAMVIVITVIGLLILAWRTGWPRWSASWYIFWMIGLAGLVTNGSDSLWGLSEFYYTFLQPLFLATFALVIAYLIYRLFRQDMQKGLLSALPLMGIPWLTFQEFVPNDLEGTITFFTWLILALTAGLILRSNSLPRSLALALGATCLIGMPYAYEGIYKGGALNFDASGPSPTQVLRAYLPFLVTTSTAVIGPLFARFYYYLGLRSGEAGRRVYRLPLLGLLLMLVANVLVFTVSTNDALRLNWPGNRLVLNSLNWLGIALFTAGFLWLVNAAHRKQAIDNPRIMPFMYLLSLLLPGMILMVLRYGFRWPIGQKFYDVGYLYSLPEFSVYLFGVGWMLVSAWVAVYLNMKSSQTIG